MEWTEWLPTEGCRKADGRLVTWYVRPSVIADKWALSKTTRGDSPAYPQGMGIFASQEEAMRAAERLEAATADGA